MPGKALLFVACAGDLLTVAAFLTGVAGSALTEFFTSGFTFAVNDFAAGFAIVFATGLAATLPLAGAALATTFADPLVTLLAAAFGAGLAAALVTTLAGVFDTGLAAGFAVTFAALFATVLLADLVGLLVVVIFEADPNFRLAAFFSVAGDFGEILFALGATAGFAGFFMLSPLNQNQGLIKRALQHQNATALLTELHNRLLHFYATDLQNQS